MTTILAELMFKIIFMAALGYLLRRLGMIDDEFQKKLSALLITYIVPCLILANGNVPYDTAYVKGLQISGVITALYYVLINVIMHFGVKALPLNEMHQRQLINLVVYPNAGFIGFPMAFALFGAEGLLYSIVLNLGFQLSCYTIGIKIASGKEMSFAELLKNPLTIAAVASLVLFVSPVRFPQAVVSTLEQVGNLSTPLSMMIIGSSLAKVKPISLLTSGWAWLVTFLRQIAIPLAIGGIMWAAGLRGLVPAGAMVSMALPTGTISIIFAQRYDLDVPFATCPNVQGNIAMIATLPFIVWLAGIWF